jgi:hypothetical protein
MDRSFIHGRHGRFARGRHIAAALGLGALAIATPARANQQTYTYAVTNPSYGKIGTLTQTIDRSPEATRVESHLRLAVEQLGIVIYRQNCDATEILNGDRLVSLQSATELNGRHFEVHGEAQGDQFVVHTAAGSATGPASTAPSDPWALKHTGEQSIVHPSTGHLASVQISGGDREIISINGGSVSARHFAVDGENHGDVWLDDLGVPIMFRTVEDGTPVDFVLQDTTAADTFANAASKHSAPPPVPDYAK